MMQKFKSPAVAAAVGILLSVAVGVAMALRLLEPMMNRPDAPQKNPVTPELKERGWDFWTIEIDNLSNELKEERGRLRKQADLLEQRAARLAADEKELNKVRTEVDALRKEIGGKLIEISADEAKNLKTLANTYTPLTPRASVAIIRELEDGFAVKILSLMKTEVVSAIFEEMSKTAGPEGASLAKRAALLSEKIRLLKVTKPLP